MDYCLPCRRHLNGALACPGCGTPADELRSPEPHLPGHTPYAGPTEPPRHTAPVWPAAEEADPSADTPDGAPDDTPDGAPDDAFTGGRAGRRDRKAAAHRRRRRRTLFVAAGFVLAAGGLSLAELGLDAPGSPATPAAAGDETTDGGVTREVGATSAAPVDGTSRTTPPSGTPSPEASVSASSSSSASASASESESESESGSPEAEDPRTPDPDEDWSAPSAPEPGSTPPPSTTPDDPPPAATPTPAPTTPTPTPTETCDRFLWWCT
ncbi:SCO2400 family protein [Streptomyces sp. H72]